MFLRADIFLPCAEPLPFRKPACSLRRWSSTTLLILSVLMLRSTSLGIFSNVIPLQLSHSPFFGILLTIPSVSSSVCSRSPRSSYITYPVASQQKPGPRCQKLDSAIHRINHYSVDNAIGFPHTYPLDSDLSGGYRYPTF